MNNALAFMIGAVVFGLLFALLAGFPIMWLWNACMPELFKLPSIDFWQALQLALLGRLIFGAGSSSPSKK